MRLRFVIPIAVLLVAAACTSEPAPRTVPSSTPSPSSTPANPETTTTTEPAGSASTTTTVASESTTTTLPIGETALALEAVAEGFEQPVFFTSSRDRPYVVDQPGRIWALVDGGDPVIVLDITDRVSFGGEQGLLGLAFHPEHAELLYVNYTRGDGTTVVSEFTMGGEPPIADPDSERIILEIPQPAGNHNGGMIAFGPQGDLWIGMGDGGAADDRFGNGQRDDTLLGAMLRIRVDPGVDPYTVVEGLGFTAPEIWAIGLRNPWRFSFDGDQIWIADVGQGAVEEINAESTEDRSLNFGWPIYEGTECFAGPCDSDDLVEPLYEYRHDEGCSVTGGYVYRGSMIPQLDGHYFFSDWCSGFIRSIAPDGVVYDWSEGIGALSQVSSFGRDESGEVYVVSAGGTVYRIVESQG
ncbi:MAG: PQQ-dependent sugar dehydrogenase [Acidimicrobiia bacterium]